MKWMAAWFLILLPSFFAIVEKYQFTFSFWMENLFILSVVWQTINSIRSLETYG